MGLRCTARWLCIYCELFGPWNSPGKDTGVGSLLQGIFLTQGLNPGLLHCRQILCCLSHHGSPFSLPSIRCEFFTTVSLVRVTLSSLLDFYSVSSSFWLFSNYSVYFLPLPIFCYFLLHILRNVTHIPGFRPSILFIFQSIASASFSSLMESELNISCTALATPSLVFFLIYAAYPRKTEVTVAPPFSPSIHSATKCLGPASTFLQPVPFLRFLPLCP